MELEGLNLLLRTFFLLSESPAIASTHGYKNDNLRYLRLLFIHISHDQINIHLVS